MPITLEKLFSPTVTSTFEFLGETVNVVWSPFRYTGEMQDIAERMVADGDAEREEVARLLAEGDQAAATEAEQKLSANEKRRLRVSLSRLLVSWDVLGDDGKPVGVDLATLNTLPDVFLREVFIHLGQENQPDPQKAPISEEP